MTCYARNETSVSGSPLMINISRCFQYIRLFKAVTGMTYAEFTALLPAFEAALRHHAATNRSSRQRQEGGGRKHTLVTEREKLFFIIFFVTCDATFDILVWLFDVDRAQTYRWVTAYLPVLGRKDVDRVWGMECASRLDYRCHAYWEEMSETQ